MFAVYAKEPNRENPLDALRIGERPEPAVPEDWVRVAIIAASLNWHDKFTLHGFGGENGRPEAFPMILGCDGVGRLDDGTRVIIYPVVNPPEWFGDETNDPQRHTFSEVLQGTFADYVAVPKRNVIPLPNSISDYEAATLGAAWLTAYHMMFSQSDIKPGETMLVQGSTGGVATALIQLGRAAGMRVWATGRTAEKRAAAERLGAARTFEPDETLPELVDVVFSPVGGPAWSHSIESVKIAGTIVMAGFTGGFQAEFDYARVVIDQIKIKGSYAGRREELIKMINFIDYAKIKPHVGQVLPMSMAGKAFELLEKGDFVGKIVLTNKKEEKHE